KKAITGIGPSDSPSHESDPAFGGIGSSDWSWTKRTVRLRPPSTCRTAASPQDGAPAA
ncbi:hypothetical protein S245_035038, partial [Arachis hypogaea]